MIRIPAIEIGSPAVVRWRDAFPLPGWHELEQVEFDWPIVETRGFWLGIINEGIVIAQDSSDGHFNGIGVIPAVLAVEVREHDGEAKAENQPEGPGESPQCLPGENVVRPAVTRHAEGTGGDPRGIPPG